jgi:hypothetical protein
MESQITSGEKKYEIHPEIKKFWEEAGHTVVGPSLIDSWEIHISTDPTGVWPLYRIEIICHGDRYRYNGQWYSEEEMLRIIKLKAFL